MSTLRRPANPETGHESRRHFQILSSHRRSPDSRIEAVITTKATQSF
jgi:hypothetical protein